MVSKAAPNIIIIQPVIPSYRVGFFNRLHMFYGDRLTVYASSCDLDVLTRDLPRFRWQRTLGPIRSLIFGIEWQYGALDVSIQKKDIVILWGAPRVMSNIALLVKARIIGAKIIWWGHYWSSTSKDWRARLRFSIMRLANCALFYTDLEIREFYDRFGEKTSFPIYSLNNGLDNSIIIKYRRNYCAQERGNRILFIGRLTEKSDFNLLLEAISHKELNDVIVDVIGDGPCLRAFQSQAQDMNVGKQVIWHGGSTNELEIAEIANKCSLFVYPGAVGLSLIHGFNYGLPAIVHDNRKEHGPEIAALFVGVNGFTFKQGNTESLAEIIVSGLSDKVILDTMSEAAIATTARTFNVEDMALRFNAAIEAESEGM